MKCQSCKRPVALHKQSKRKTKVDSFKWERIQCDRSQKPWSW